MNQFHEINLLKSRGDINGALSLINSWSESVARKIMKKAGYPVPSDKGRAFWLWVQQTLMQAARNKRCGYQHRFSHSFSRVRSEAETHYEDYAIMMAELNVKNEPESPSESQLPAKGSVVPVDTAPETGIRISGPAEGMVNSGRNTQPAATASVNVLQFEKATGCIVTHETENRRINRMRFHFTADSLLSCPGCNKRSRDFKCFCLSRLRIILNIAFFSLSKIFMVYGKSRALSAHIFKVRYDKNRLVDEIQTLPFDRHPGDRIRTSEVRRRCKRRICDDLSIRSP
ncbi:hypothetical protein [Pantoea ananatis]|uniref:hypothetical protein n=1 Tax=Pantoea ananas TaxID=553 RepID=UPI000AD23F45|nr:hypothetical protein [Pantoea ananatis]